MKPLRGSFLVLSLFDVAEEIGLDALRAILPAQPRREPALKHPSPEYVRFERPPVIEDAGMVQLPGGEQLQASLHYFEYGVVSVHLELPFEGHWQELSAMSCRLVAAPEIEKMATELLQARLERIRNVLKQPYETPSSEDYCIIHLSEALDEKGAPMSAATLLATHGAHVAAIIRGEAKPLSPAEQAEALQANISYYPDDLIVVGWLAAFLYDTPTGAAPVIQLLEYANIQLLEFRHYDDVLTRVLDGVYKLIERSGGMFRKWRTASDAERLNALRLDITELTERMDNSIKFLSDMFYARAYRLAANRVGVQDYRTLVERKLRTAGDLYEFLTNEFHQSRSFVLEALVVAILVIELVNLFVKR